MKSLYSQYAKSIKDDNIRYIIPPSVEIDFTNKCNQACVYCNVEEFRAKFPDQTKLYDYHKLIDRLESWHEVNKGHTSKVNTVTFVGGGEPTVRKGYENVIEHSIDSGFMTSIVTNGIKLDKLLNVNNNTLKKMAWIGLDIDSGLPDVYEEIRRSKSKKSPFNNVKDTAKELTSIGVNVDLKVLLMPKTDTKESIESIFQYAKDVNARMCYFRLCLMDATTINNFGDMYIPNEWTEDFIKDMSIKYGIRYRLNITRSVKRIYKKCHALFLLPIFAADSKLYICCENRGNPVFDLTDWTVGDFRKEWGAKKHIDIYNTLDLNACPMCRPHCHNMEIDKLLDNNLYEQDLFF